MENKPRRLQTILIILVSLFVGYSLGVKKISLDWQNYKPALSVVDQEPPPGIDVDFSPFWTVWQKLQTNYYDKSKLDTTKMVNGAISGMIQSLGDPYTLYLPPTQNTDFKQELAGQFQGIGAELGMQGKQIIVIAPLDGSPAEKAGIKPGDAILKVDGQIISGWTLDQAVSKIRGKSGTTVVLSIQHKNEQAAKDIAITRNVITVKSVDGWVKSVKDIPSIEVSDHKDDQIAYVRLSQFGDQTNKDWLSLIKKLDVQIANNPKFKGFILDLRNNPGGYLTDAQFIASEFIKDGTIVIEDDGRGNQQALSVNRAGLLTDVPVIVLINKGSASASEIVAGALRDHNRAKLVGETSFGKGTVQQSEDLGNGAGLHITIAKWLTPNGTWVNGKGLTPDVSVAQNPKDPSHDTQLEKAVQILVQ